MSDQERNIWEAGGHASKMTLRDWFAGQALAGSLAADADLGAGKASEWAYRVADAMLKARKGVAP